MCTMQYTIHLTLVRHMQYTIYNGETHAQCNPHPGETYAQCNPQYTEHCIASTPGERSITAQLPLNSLQCLAAELQRTLA